MKSKKMRMLEDLGLIGCINEIPKNVDKKYDPFEMTWKAIELSVNPQIQQRIEDKYKELMEEYDKARTD